MKKEQGFTLIELLIVVAIIAIIAAIAVPNLMTARMAANETSAMSGLRTIGSAQVSFSAVNGGYYALLNELVEQSYLDPRFGDGGSANGYRFKVADAAIPGVVPSDATFKTAPDVDGDEGYTAVPIGTGSTGRYSYAIGPDLALRHSFEKGADGITVTMPRCGTTACEDGALVGGTAGSASAKP